MALVALAVEPFNAVAGKAVVFAPIADPMVLPVLIGLGLLISFVAGFYPALMLSSFEPARVLKQS
jgi:putative ABC transport system permease protein